MTIRLNPYLSFRDTARQALEHYHAVLGGSLQLSTFAEMHASDDPTEQDKVMHGLLETDRGLVLMAADTPNNMEVAPPSGFAVSLSGDDEAELRRYWDGLSADGTVALPLEPAPWGDSFGMLVDRFGVSWMVNISAPQG
ncbi:MAG: VOC family protein [Actinomycetota bacterium]|nr:VOC family protein [Actinomycetota bacterium]